MSAVLSDHQHLDFPADDWRATTSLECLKARARLLQDVRVFFAARDVMEVETPLLSAGTTPDPALRSMTTRFTGPGSPQGKKLYLQTSPEYAMKRLLACGSGSIFQVCKAFRDGEAGRVHNPEFTLLEWYRVGYDHHMLMDEVEDLVATILGVPADFDRIPYRQAFEFYTGINPHSASVELLQDYVTHRSNVRVKDISLTGRDAWLDLIMSHVIEPQLGNERPTFIYDYPASKAALAAIREDEYPVAERFELYVRGMELANGFHELTDMQEQGQRFARDCMARVAENLPDVDVDARLLAALDHGLPPCAGVAMGLDRLLLIRQKATTLREILAFPIDCA